MENASRALIMAASVLLGVMLISIGVYLFSIYGDYSSDMYQRIEQTQIDQFNSQFLKFYGTTLEENSTKPEKIKCTIHDIVTLASFANQNNQDNEIQDLRSYDKTTNYVQIDILNKGKNLEKKTPEELLNILKQNTTKEVTVTDELGNTKIETRAKYYTCEKAEISNITKRVCYMQFKEE